jgi:hypothetical protein
LVCGVRFASRSAVTSPGSASSTRVPDTTLRRGGRVRMTSGVTSRMTPFRLVTSFLVLSVSLVSARWAVAADAEQPWAALVAGGHVALIRHANAPPGYGGDPPGFRMDDCKTQRNPRRARPPASPGARRGLSAARRSRGSSPGFAGLPLRGHRGADGGGAGREVGGAPSRPGRAACPPPRAPGAW